MKKKLIGIFVVMLMISSALTTILFSDDGTVEAIEDVNLDYDWVWRTVEDFANVIRKVNWSENGESGIPKGRSWATAGENYTRDYILWPNIGIPNNPCGLTNYSLLPIKYVDTEKGKEPLFKNKRKQYSTKIVINNYGLTLENDGEPSKLLPYSEFFPYGIGFLPNLFKNFRTHFSSASIRDLNENPITNPFANASESYYNVSVRSMLNNYTGLLAGSVKYIKDNQSIPKDQNDTVFLMNESISCETKIQNITDNATGCILIYDQNRNYNFNDAEGQNCSIVQINCTHTNLSLLLNDLENGTEYFVMLNYEAQTLTFINLSNYQTIGKPWVGLMRLRNESDPKGSGLKEVIDQNIKCFKYGWLNGGKCKAIIIAGPGDTHFMLHTVNGWGWFNDNENHTGPYHDFPLTPMFSVNDTVWNWLHQRIGSATVSGFIDQDLKRQTRSKPGVISHNVVAYRNISHSPDDKIVVLSNRIDGWWSETPGDSGVGGAILLGIAKFFQDNNITPKYNLTFLFTTGEEYGMRGAQHFVDTHPYGTGDGEYNYIHWIGFDQLGFNLTGDGNTLQTEIKTQNESRSLIRAIANDTDYKNRTHNYYDFYVNYTHGGGSEDYVWKDNCPHTILFEKDRGWNGWHRAGNNFTEGDSKNNIDRNDVNVTSELAWNITKYFTVNPNCWFNNASFKVFDSPNDGDTLNDSIQTTFTIHTVLPNDKVRVKLFYNINGNPESPNHYYSTTDYTITPNNNHQTLTFSIPDTASQGNYSIYLRLYNSTGRINDILGMPGTQYNDTSNTSNVTHLYHPLGYTKTGELVKCVDENISGSVFTANENGRADNITAFINQAYMSPGPYTCMLYRASDKALIGTTTSSWASLPQGNPESTSWWAVFNFTDTKPLLVKGTQYVITCWGNSPYSYISYSNSSSSGTGRYEQYPYGSPPNPANFTSEPRYYSLYIGYTPDVTGPQITNVTASPHTVGFGYNVTITAHVTDPGSGVHLVKTRINVPGGGQSNNTMTPISGDLYQYIFTDTWRVGQYNYSIWAQDNETNGNTSATYHFHVSANATISIATLKDSYTGSQYINITDPPNPQGNLTIINRGLTWNTYANASSGENILEAYQGPVNYQEENGTWTPINNTISQLASNHPAYVYGYRTGNNKGLYGVYFKANAQLDWPVAFTYNKSDDPTVHVVRSKLVGVGYLDPGSNWAYQYLQSVQSSQGQANDDSITFPSVFIGTNATWSYDNTRLKEEITLSNTTKTMLQNHPPSQYGLTDATSYLVFITKLEYQNLNLSNNSGLLEGNVTITETGVEFRDTLGQVKCAVPLGDAYELHHESHTQRLTYRIIHLHGDTYLLSGLKLSTLNAMMFPVVIDPTLSVYSLTTDGYLYNSSTNYNTVRNATSGTISSTASYITIGQKKQSSTYYVYRGCFPFNTSMIPSNAYLDSAVLSLYKKDDYSSTDFTITIQNGQPTYPHNPLQAGDYAKDHYTGNGGGLNTVNFINGRNNITLSSLSWINTTGITKLCLRSSRDINGTTPTGNEYVNVYSGNANDPSEDLSYKPKLIITYRNQSKIKNTGSTDIKGYLLIQVQFYDTGKGHAPRWIVDNDTINETTPRTITSGNQLPLDTIFNGKIRASNLQHGTGSYRVYTALRDPEGTILKTNTGAELKVWWQFNKT